MTTLPTGAQLVAAANVSAMQGLMSDQATAISEMPGGAVATTLTIAAGAVTPTVACHLVDTEAAAASDDLTNIVTTNHTDGRRLLISMVDAARIVTVKHNAGGAGQVALANSYDLVLKVGGWVELKRTGANWEEVGRSQNLISTVQLSGAVNEAYATVASHATTADIWAAKGNVVNFTGTATVTAFPAAPQAGVRRRLICAGACSFTAGASMVIDGVASASTLTVAAGDVVDIESVSTASFKLHHVPVGGVGDMRGANNLAVGAGGVANAATARANLGLGSAAVVNTGVSNGDVPAMDATGYPAADGSRITGIRAKFQPYATVSSSGTVSLDGAGSSTVQITGTTTITAITLASGSAAFCELAGALTLTSGASLILPGGANITTAAGDTCVFIGEGSGIVRCYGYQRANGQPVVAPSSGAMAFVSSTSVGTGASITVNTQFQAGYDYVFLFADVYNSGGSTALCVQFGTGATPTIQTTGYVYSSVYTPSTNATTVPYASTTAQGMVGTSTANIQISYVGGSAGKSASGRLDVFNPASTATPAITWSMTSLDSGGVVYFVAGGGSRTAGTGAITALKFSMYDGSNFGGGTITVLSIKKS